MNFVEVAHETGLLLRYRRGIFELVEWYISVITWCGIVKPWLRSRDFSQFASDFLKPFKHQLQHY
jgi:hypothetical protein